MTAQRIASFAVLIPLGLTRIAAAQERLVGMGQLPGASSSWCVGISADGTVAVGTTSDWRVVRWTALGGPQDLGVTPSGGGAYATCISPDGTTIGGDRWLAQSSGTGFLWSATGGLMELPSFPKGHGSVPEALSANGAVAVGRAEDYEGSYWPFRWSSKTGIVQLPHFPGDWQGGAHGVTWDGPLAVGGTTDRAVSWLYAQTPVNLGLLAGGLDAEAVGVSADGSIIVGDCTFSNGVHAYRWTAATGMVDLGALPGAIRVYASAVSADGLTVVGEAWVNGVIKAVVWTPHLGLVDLQVYLTSLGGNLTEWSLTSASCVSANGLSIGGSGRRNGIPEGWIANIGLTCRANCDGSTISPVLRVTDFLCFFSRFTEGDAYANCDGSTVSPVLNVNDYICFLNSFAAGCS